MLFLDKAMEGNIPSEKKSKLPYRSYWREERLGSWRFFCPVCERSRRVSGPPHPYRFSMILGAAAATAFALLLGWKVWGWKGAVWALPIWMLIEISFRLISRARLKCTECGFDPYLWLSSRSRAQTAMEKFWVDRYAEKGGVYLPRRDRFRIKSRSPTSKPPSQSASSQ